MSENFMNTSIRRQSVYPVAVVIAGLAGLLGACGGSTDVSAVRLVDEFSPELVSGAPKTVKAGKPIEWNFRESDSGTLGWTAGRGIAGLRVRDGVLTGRTTSPASILYVQREAAPDPDQLHSVEIRVRVDKGANLSVNGAPAEQPLQQVIGASDGLTWPMMTPPVPGEEFQTITLRPQRVMTMSSAGTILLRPSDSAGAEFAIESIRLVSTREYLSKVPSGVGWHGLSQIFRETIVSRSPEVIQMDIDVPARPWLDLHVGTVEDGPVKFALHVAQADGGKGDLLLERTVTSPHRWEATAVDLTAYAGRTVTLSLSLDVETDGTIGFWGSPVIRDRTGRSPAANVPPLVQLGSSAEPPQGVILMMADTLRKDHLDGYGYSRETAPFLNELASNGTLFLDNIAQATWTKVSTPTIMTSLYPISHRVRDFPDRLPAAATTLAEVYCDAGYATVSYPSVLFTGKFSNLHQGFEELHEPNFIERKGYPSKTARRYIDRLGDWIEAHRDVPFFVFLHVFDPHDPFEPYRPYDSLWADPAKKEHHEEQLEKVRKVIKDPLRQRFGMPNRGELTQVGVDPDEYVNHDIDWYDASIRAMDVEVARLFERLRTLGLADGTVFAFVSDHGEEFLDHGSMFHGQTVYGELTNVPLMLHAPGRVPAGLLISQTVGNIDLMPTLLELSHLPLPDGLQGQSLLPLLVAARDTTSDDEDALIAQAEAAGWSHRPAFSEKPMTTGFGAPPPGDTEAYAAIFDGWKLVHNTAKRAGTPEFELFDHRQDPLNLKNLADQHPDRVKELADKIAAWRKIAEEQALPETDSTEGLSDEELQRLRSLGYIQ